MNARWFGKVYLLVLGVAIFYWPVVTSAQTITYGPANTFATPASDFVNTGSGGTVGGETVSGNTPTQWVATQFTLTETTAITQVSGWFGATGAGGAINVVIRVDNPANPSLPVPGAEIWSQSFTVPAQNAPNWVNFSNFIPVLAPGTYWLSFEPPVTSALKTGMYGPSANPQPNSAFYVPSNGRWINYNEGNGHTTAYPGVQISGLYLETSVGQGVVPFGTAARTITQGTVFNMFPFSQYLDPVGGVGQARTLQWNIYSPAAEASAYGALTASPNLQGSLLTAGAYSASGTNASGAARGIVFATFVNTGSEIDNLQVNGIINGNISFDSGVSFPVQAAAGVYVFDSGLFSTTINNALGNGQTLGQFFLGGSALAAGYGADFQPNVATLFPPGTLMDSSSITSWPLICTSNCPSGYQVQTDGIEIPANAVFTVLFDVSAASLGSGSAEGQGIGNFLDTLSADASAGGLFSDGSGNPITTIAGPVAVVSAQTPNSVVVSPGTSSNPIGSTATLTATVTDSTGTPISNAIVNFAITSGPHIGFTTPVGTDSNGNAILTFTDTLGQAGADSVTASTGGLQSTAASLEWTSPGPLYTLTLNPSTTSVAAGTGQAYTATGVDFFGNSTDPGTVTYTISPDGTCTGATCTPTAPGPHSVTGSGSNPVVGTITGTASLTVTGGISSLLITASSPTMTFGGTVPTITPLYTYGTSTLTSTPPSGLTTPPTCITTATSTSPVGSSPSTSCLGAVDANYTISYVPGSVTVSAASLTITASSPTMTFGGTVPTIAPLYTYGTSTLTSTPPSGLTTPPSCTTTATSTSPVGSSPSTSCSGAVDANYTISYVPGSVTVSASSLTITASSPTMTFGGTVPTITPLYTYGTSTLTSTPPGGLTTPPSCTTTATSTSPVGSSPSTSCSGAVDANYTISYVPGSVTVSAASLTITASSPTMTFGGTVPTVTPLYTYGTFTLTSTAPAGLTMAPTCVTTATSTSPVASYPTSCSGAVDSNYTIGYVGGSLKVNPANLTITASSPTMTLGGSVPTITASYTYGSLVNYATPPVGLTPPTCSAPGVTSSSPVGTYSTSCSGAVDSNYTIGYVPGVLTIVNSTGKTNPVITWPTPAAITYGTSLSSAQLDATANVAGTFAYNPGAKTVLTAGQHTLSVIFTPTNTSAYNTVTATVGIQVNQTTPPVLWVPVPIVYGTPLGLLQLDALTGVPGTFVYTPPAGTVLHPGNQQLSAVFIPKDATDFQTITVHTTLVVLKALPNLTWSQPGSITAGTPLSATQLDARANVAGAFVYNPPTGTILPAGTATLRVTFTPADSADYQAGSAQVSLTVKAKK